MSKRNCCVINCKNSGYQLKKWRKNYCNQHKCNYGTQCCTCNPPFELFTFPRENKDSYSRSVWTKNVYRVNTDGSNWQPNENTRICSHHFVDGFPSVTNPFPTLSMGHDYSITTKSRPPPKERLNISSKTLSSREKKQDLPETSNAGHCLLDHDYIVNNCNSCRQKDEEIKHLKASIIYLENKIKKQNIENKVHKPISVLSKVCSSDQKMKFYTGIPSILAFNRAYNIIEPEIKHLRYWRGPKFQCNPLKTKKIKMIRLKKLCAKEEMIMTLMKLRLGLLDADLADRFEISSSQVSRIFTTWVKVLAHFFGSLVYNPPKEIVRGNLPPKFQNSKYSSVRHIIDCSEIFIEKPQNLDIQNLTWSDYKKHNTAKFLISIIPSGMINFISACWAGRASDKQITMLCGFLDIIEPHDTILADRGFQIQEEVTLLNARLIVPPGRKGAAQMSKVDVIKTKEVANRRIYIEQAIRRMKTFRILKFELPLTLYHHVDYICKIIAGICNMYIKLPKY